MDEAALHELFAPFGEIRTRRMFGGIGIRHGERMFAVVVRGDLYMRVDDESAPLFEAEGAQPFVYEKSRSPVKMPYRRLPEAAFDDPDALLHWAGLADAAARRAAARPPRRRRKKDSA